MGIEPRIFALSYLLAFLNSETEFPRGVVHAGLQFALLLPASWSAVAHWFLTWRN